MHIRSIAPAIGIAMLGLSVSTTTVLSADYPVLRGSQIEDTPPPPNFSSGNAQWSGFYFGGLAGMNQTQFEPGTGLQELARFAYRNTTLGTDQDMGGFVKNLPKQRDSGAGYGAFAGYNLVFGDVVLGLEADYTRSGHEFASSDFIARRSATSTGQTIDWSMTSNVAARLHDYATARLRMGWTYGSIMPFGTIGAAFGRFDAVSTIDATANIVTNPNTATERSSPGLGYPLRVGAARKNIWGVGMAFGGGVDWLVTENLFLRAEYQYIAFGDVEGVSTSVNTGRIAAALKF